MIFQLLLKCVAHRRQPDFVIGGDRPYLRRWWIARNRFFSIYLHQILRDDDDRALHDHPWWNVSYLLKGDYFEVVPLHHPSTPSFVWLLRKRGQVVFRSATAAHRLVLYKDVYGTSFPCWSLFITGPRVREWGFWCPQGWRPWLEFVDSRDPGRVGRGCE